MGTPSIATGITPCLGATTSSGVYALHSVSILCYAMFTLCYPRGDYYSVAYGRYDANVESRPQEADVILPSA